MDHKYLKNVFANGTLLVYRVDNTIHVFGLHPEIVSYEINDLMV